MKNLQIRWQDHVGTIASILLATVVALKIYAVADWNPTTATGIMATNGTTNVIIGSLLASLPIAYWFLFMFALPRLEQKLELKNKSTIEKYAVFTHTWPILLFLFIVPLYLVFIALALLIVIILASLIQSKRKSMKTKNHYVSRFEANTILLSSIATATFFSLHAPWLPPQTIHFSGKGDHTVYVLSSNDSYSEVLLDRPRQILKIDTSALNSAKYCENSSHWITRTLYQALGDKPNYPTCPEVNRK